ncbi:MAG: hypothetical protein GY811_06715 [Myxococcales bacterium]|nr:hypothetical protein [Myxococcales bacterium]
MAIATWSIQELGMGEHTQSDSAKGREQPSRQQHVVSDARDAETSAGEVTGSRTQYQSADLSGIDFSDKDLSGFDFSFANLSGAHFERANLTGALLHKADITDAEFLMARLNDADLSACVGTNAGFAHADLSGANLFLADLSGSSFASAKLVDADLRKASVRGARFTGAELLGANLTRADLRDADLTGASVAGAEFAEVDLRGASLRRLKGFQNTSWLGVDIMNVDFCGAFAVRRFISDQNYLHEFRYQSRTNELLYWAWWLTSDCGRSLMRWSILTFFLASLFGCAFILVDIPFGDNETAISPFYFSIVTLTTLGYGDVVPTTALQQVVVMMEVCTGYLMLGGLISIFANKMARRAD